MSDKVKRCCVCDVVCEIPVWWKPCGQTGKVKIALTCCGDCYRMLLGRWNAINVIRSGA